MVPLALLSLSLALSGLAAACHKLTSLDPDFTQCDYLLSLTVLVVPTYNF